jgi:hypothetical protein
MSDLITLPRATVQQALEALENSSPDQYPEHAGVFYDAKDALKAALEQPEPWVKSYCGGKPNYTTPAEQEPVAWACFKNGELQTELIGTEADVDFWCASDEPEMQGMVQVALYTHPPRREWRGLTEEEIQSVIQLEREKRFQRRPPLPLSMTELSHAIEAKLKEKNHE